MIQRSSSGAGAGPRDVLARAAVAALAVGSAGVVLRATGTFGPGLDGDAVWTISAAESLRRGEGLITCLGEPYTLWPPLYPALLAAIEAAGVERIAGLRWLHALAAAATVALGAQLVRAASGSGWLAAAHALLVSACVALYWQFAQVGSEAVFVPLALGALACGSRFTATRRRNWLAAATLLAALACLQRYLGVAVVAGLGAVLVFDRGEAKLAVRARRAALATALAVAPLAAWLARNRWLEGKWTGGRAPARLGLGETAVDFVRALGVWLDPAGAGGSGLALAWVLALAVLAVAGLAIGRGRVAVPARAASVALATYVAAYCVALIATSAGVEVDRIGHRLVVPLLPAFLALAAIGARALAAGSSRGALIARVAFAVVVVAWGVRGAMEVALFAAEGRRHGLGGFATDFWSSHPLVLHLRTAPIAAPAHSNLPELVYLETGVRASMLVGSRRQHARVGEDAAADGREHTLVWFQNEGKPALFIEEIERAARVESRFECAQGRVVAVRPR